MTRLRKIETAQMTEAMPIVRAWLLLSCGGGWASSVGDEGGSAVD
jgi:hypothetical protein